MNYGQSFWIFTNDFFGDHSAGVDRLEKRSRGSPNAVIGLDPIEGDK